MTMFVNLGPVSDVWTRTFWRPQESVDKRLRQHVSVNVCGHLC